MSQVRKMVAKIKTHYWGCSPKKIWGGGLPWVNQDQEDLSCFVIFLSTGEIAQHMNCADANLALPGSVQAMPMTSDQYILWTWTHVPIEDFPPCDKRFNSEETDKENTTRALGKEISGAAGETNDCKSFRLKHTHIQDSSSSVEISAAAVLGKL